MAEKTVRCLLPVLGLVRGEETTVEVTPFLERVIDRGYLEVVEPEGSNED
jgi:hypothetical protein